MAQNQYALQKSVSYFFNRSKDISEENESKVITLFARLTKEIVFEDGCDTYKKAETVWVEIEDVKMEEATEKMKDLPNCMQQYRVTESVFHSLCKLSKSCPKELYYVTPLHRESKRKEFIT